MVYIAAKRCILKDGKAMTDHIDSAGHDPNIDPQTDLDIISNTFRAILDQDAFEAMIDSWQTKLARIGDDAGAAARISGPLLAQLRIAQRTLEALDVPVVDDPLARAVQDVPGLALVLSPEGRIASINTEGERLMAARQGAFLDPECVDPRSVSDYRALLRAAGSRTNRAQAILRLLPRDVERPAADPILCEAYFLETPGRAPQDKAFLVVRSLEIEWSARAAEMLSQAFGLSQAELEVARLYFALRDVAAVAAARGVSLLTARTQLKSVMAKTECPSQVDLMRLLAMTATRALSEHRSQTARWRDPTGREEAMTLPDGRLIAWTWAGDPQGRPAVLLRGLPMCYLMPPQAEEPLRAAGIKVYSLSRPGYGNSSMHPELSPLEDNLACLRAFLDRVVGAPCLGIGMSNGLLPLLAEAEANPARFHGLLALGYTGVLDRSGVTRLQPVQQAMMRLVKIMPWLVEMMANQGYRMIRQHGVDWYIERAYRGRLRDTATCAEPNLMPFVRNACAHMLVQGPGAFVRDLHLVHAEIDRAVETLQVPLVWLAPTEDGIFDAGSYARFERRNPLARLQPVPEAGELLLYQRMDVVLEQIEALCRADSAV